MPPLPPDPNAPHPVEPFPDLLWAWAGFFRLSNSRPQGMNGYLRIPLSEIEAYCRLQGFGPEKRTEFLFYVEHLDAIFMEHVEKLREAAERQNQNPNTPQQRTPPRGRRR